MLTVRVMATSATVAGAATAAASSSSSSSSEAGVGAETAVGALHGASEEFSLRVAKADFKFNAAHFVCHESVRGYSKLQHGLDVILLLPLFTVYVTQGQRERMHGHGYRVAVSHCFSQPCRIVWFGWH